MSQSEKIASPTQLLLLAGSMLQNIPLDLHADIVQDWIDDPEAQQQYLAGLRDGPIGRVQRSDRKLAKQDKKFLSSDIAAQYGYMVVEDLDERTKFEMKDLEYIGFLKEGDGDRIGGKEMRERAKKLNGYFSLADGMYMLGHQEEILESTCGHNCIVLAATLLRHVADRRLYVACLRWCGDQWVLCFYWVDFDFFGRGRLPHCK